MNELILGWARKVKKRNSKRQNEVNDYIALVLLVVGQGEESILCNYGDS